MSYVSVNNSFHNPRIDRAQTNAVQFLLYIFFFPETLYLRARPHHKSAFQQEYLTFGRIDPEPLHFYDFYQPILLAGQASIVIPAVSYSIVFAFAGVLNTVEIPQLFAPTFGFNPQEIGLQFIGLIVGYVKRFFYPHALNLCNVMVPINPSTGVSSVLGELLGGPISDLTMNRRARSLGHRPAPEYRLWCSYIGFLTAIVGQVVFFIQLNDIRKHYNVTPIIGVGIASFGNQVVTTVLVTCKYHLVI